MISLGALVSQLFSREKKQKAEEARRALVERFAGQAHKALTEAAERTGLTAGPDYEPSLTGVLGGATVEVGLAETGDEGLMMRFSASSAQKRPLVLTLAPRPRGLLALVKKPKALGIPELDETFSSDASSVEEARAVLGERSVTMLLSLPDRMPLYFDLRDGKATLDVSGVELDPERIVAILAWLAEVVTGKASGPPYRAPANEQEMA